ncbi:MAG: FKBP-type peptidyl-prolyl cis-trans isomerase [Bacteroidales bacterium]|nr:FKBP-type peptidyl-prolyl cis-trans isomerase [Bacteroidales bacterium]
MTKLLQYLLPAAAVLCVTGCAQSNTSSTGQLAQEYVQLWLDKYYNGVQPDQWGVCILEDTPGTGALWDSEITYSYLTSTIRTLEGTVTSNTDEKWAKQLGTYQQGNYYGPKYHATGAGSGYAGTEYMLQGMRVGGTRTALIPAWLLTNNRYNTLQEYLDNCPGSTHYLYTLKLEGQCQDILQEEKDSLRSYVTRHYGADVQSCTYKGEDGIFYFISDSTAFAGVEQRSATATLKLDYSGYLLNGQLFDTTILQDALDSGMYQEGSTPEPVSITFSSTITSIAMDNSTSLIEGFQAGLYKMHWAGQKATILFVSNLGYSTSGNGDVIPSYSPLLFKLELLEEEE